MPCHHTLEGYLVEYIERAQLADAGRVPLFATEDMPQVTSSQCSPHRFAALRSVRMSDSCFGSIPAADSLLADPSRRVGLPSESGPYSRSCIGRQLSAPAVSTLNKLCCVNSRRATHSITASACAMRRGGTVRPSACAARAGMGQVETKVGAWWWAALSSEAPPKAAVAPRCRPVA